MRLLWCVLLLSVASFGSVFGEVGPLSTVVVVNSGSESSKAVADEYVRLRGIPKGNVVELSDIPDQETIDADQFRDRILQPLFAELDKREIRSKIDCVAYSSDFPTAIDVRPDTKGQQLPQVLTPTASINGLTFLYQRVLAKDVRYLELNSNRYFRKFVTVQTTKPLSPQDALRLGAVLQSAAKDKTWEPAEKLLRELLIDRPESPDLHYNLACMLAQQGRAEDAMNSLDAAVKAGWMNHAHAARDVDLESLREKDEFKAALAAMAKITLKVEPSLPFGGALKFSANGSVTDDEGESYLLSTVLGVTRGRGNSVEEVIANLRQSVAADASRPAGTVYLMTNADIRSTTRDGLFNSVAAELTALNVKSEIIKGSIPNQKLDVAGAVIGIATFDWAKSESKILPGAICEHLTSFGGVMRANSGQTPFTELIRHGAAGSSGTVAEPYAIAAKFPTAFIHVHYARGSTLAESFYQSVNGPYQLLIVGDPLCRPWAPHAAPTEKRD